MDTNSFDINDIKDVDKKKLKRKKKSRIKIVIITIASVFAVLIGTFIFLLYGPYSGFRNWLITTAMTTLNHQYLATWFYSDKEIEKVLNKNQVIETGESTDTSLVSVGTIDFSISNFKNKYEKEILVKDKGNDNYKIINISGKGYKGYLVAIYNPSKLKVMTTKYLGKQGQYLVKMANQQGATLAINGGGFYDPNYSSSGGIPQGTVIKNGKIVSTRTYNRSGGIIGFDKSNKLVLGKMSAKEAINKGIRDAVTFGPFLIVNGKASFVKGNGGWGTAPRTAIGQRSDGIVLLLVIDGRTIKYPGADMGDLVEIMQNYGAINAANLDGGTSSGLVVKGKLINDPIDSTGKHETRPIATGIGLFE